MCNDKRLTWAILRYSALAWVYNFLAVCATFFLVVCAISPIQTGSYINLLLIPVWFLAANHCLRLAGRAKRNRRRMLRRRARKECKA